MQPRIIHFLLIFFLLMLSGLPHAWAQTEDGPNDSPTAQKILLARSTYAQPEDVATGSDGQRPPEFAHGRRRPSFPPAVRYPYPGGAYGGMWRQPANKRHALIGALIGFGVGAAIGAKGNKDPHARVSAPVLFGSFGALIGAAIGASHP
jgi:hypothetical protein